MADAAYGLGPLVVVNTALFIVFAVSFFHPRTSRDWRAMGAYSAFLVALFTEMYGTPLTVYLLGSWLGSRFPGLRATHGGGLWLIAAAWRVLHEAARPGRLATTGPYARVRHPQYDGFLLVMVGFLLQWPTIPTLVMFPILVVVYARLARAEEREVAARFGKAWAAYAAHTPAFIPRRHPPTRPRRGGSPTRPDTFATRRDRGA